jgi:Mlc titration factor MtfA (ptsG expression regulator)
MLLEYILGAVILLLVLFLVFLILFFFYGWIEAIYMYIFNKPFFVHKYRKLEKLTPSEIGFLKKHSHFYLKLKPQYQEYFQHRVFSFLQKYEFIPREDIVITQEMKVKIAATAIQLTFGFRTYLMNIFQYIVIYPDIYESTVTYQWHKGEFNPRMKAIVFSWKHFEEGFESDNDNLNLGYHEFAHALNMHGLKSKDASASHFAWLYKKMMRYLENPLIQKRLVTSEYFRIYAYSNQYEFFAVLVEHFFETPDQFKKEFPILFKKMQQMINFNPSWFRGVN